MRTLGVLSVVLLIAAAGPCLASAATARPYGARQPWIVVWRRGVNGTHMWDRLCPSVSLPDADPSAARKAYRTAPRADDAPSATTLLLDVSLPLIPCLARYDSLINGFAARLTVKELQALQASLKDSIDFVVEDQPVGLGDALTPATAGPNPAATSQVAVTNNGSAGAVVKEDGGSAGNKRSRRELPEELDAPWGLDSIDQSALPLDGVYTYDNLGTGVNVYVLDTGIRSTHAEFRVAGPDGAGGTTAAHGGASRVGRGYDAVSDSGGGSTEDCHGHGTHVAAIVGGLTYGVAKNVTLHPVKVLDCNGRAMVSSLLKGLNWVAQNHVQPAVVHMSVEGTYSSVVNSAVERLVTGHNIHVIVSSGNSARDACRVSPGSTPSAVTVAAIDSNLARWAFANWGPCVDIFAPGVNILSAVPDSDSSAGMKSGTSMAAPFVTGVVALYVERHPGASTDEVVQRLFSSALRGAVRDDPLGYGTLFPQSPETQDLPDLSATPNRLLQSRLAEHATIEPGTLLISTADAAARSPAPRKLRLRLLARPGAAVEVTAAADAAWDGAPLADVRPARTVVAPSDWDAAAGEEGAVMEFEVWPRSVSDGAYFLEFRMASGDPSFDGVLLTARVTDERPRSGDTAANPRVVAALPFQDRGDTSQFGDDYSCQAQDAAPDVVYALTPQTDMQVTISTCGSSFDTKLILATDLGAMGTYICNDDDRTCTSGTSNSRIDAALKAGVTYYAVVDGYYRSSGAYQVTIACSSCKDGRAALTTPNTAAGNTTSGGKAQRRLLDGTATAGSCASTAGDGQCSPSPTVPAKWATTDAASTGRGSSDEAACSGAATEGASSEAGWADAPSSRGEMGAEGGDDDGISAAGEPQPWAPGGPRHGVDTPLVWAVDVAGGAGAALTGGGKRCPSSPGAAGKQVET